MKSDKKETLQHAAQNAIDVLLSLTPYTNRPCYAPHLRELAMRLDEQ